MEEITRWRITFDLAMVAMTSAREVWKRGHVETGELEIKEASSASVFDVSSSKLCFFKKCEMPIPFSRYFWFTFQFQGHGRHGRCVFAGFCVFGAMPGWSSRPQTPSFHWSNRTLIILEVDSISSTQLDYAVVWRTCCSDAYATLAVAWQQPQGLMILMLCFDGGELWHWGGHLAWNLSKGAVPWQKFCEKITARLWKHCQVVNQTLDFKTFQEPWHGCGCQSWLGNFGGTWISPTKIQSKWREMQNIQMEIGVVVACNSLKFVFCIDFFVKFYLIFVVMGLWSV